MKTYAHRYTGSGSLAAFVKRHRLTRFGERLLVQAFIDSLDEDLIRQVHTDLTTLLPQAAILGATSCGSILNGRIYEGAVVLHFLAFERGRIRTLLLTRGTDDRQLGEQLVRQLAGPETQLLLLFADASGVTKREVLTGLHAAAPTLYVAGGAAANPFARIDSWIFDRSGLTTSGIVGAALDIPGLRVHLGYVLNWRPIGRTMTVTAAQGHLLQALDGQPAAEVYRRYLGDEVVENITRYGTIFPLIIERDGVQVARSPGFILEDQSVYLGGDVEVGDRVRFAYGHVPSILHKTHELAETLAPGCYDALLIYSCMARKAFLREATQLEVLPLQKVAPTAGFFTFGEFYKGPDSLQLLNSTLTYVALSDRNPAQTDCSRQSAPAAELDPATEDQSRLLGGLTHLVQTYTEELEAANAQLSNYVEELQSMLDQLNEKTREIEQQKHEIEAQNEAIALQRDQLQTTLEQLVRLDRMKEELTAMVVHDLKNPLNAVLAMASLPPDAQRLQVIRGAGQQMANLVSNLLDIQKYEDNALKLKLEAVPVRRLLETACQQTEFLAQQKSIDFDIQAPDELIVEADSDLLIRVLVNLLTNAIRYAPNGDTLQLVAQFDEARGAVFRVTDHGRGIPPDQLEKIFEKFAQVETGRAAGPFRNTGLGLTFCKLTVQAHGGTIRAYSEEGRYTTMEFNLPSARFDSCSWLPPGTQRAGDAVGPLSLDLQQAHAASLEQLRHLPPYDLSGIFDVLAQLPDSPLELANWKAAVEEAVLSADKDRLRELLGEPVAS